MAADLEEEEREGEGDDADVGGDLGDADGDYDGEGDEAACEVPDWRSEVLKLSLVDLGGGFTHQSK